MKYDLIHIKEKFNADEKLDFLFFWGHQPKKDGSISQSCFSQWWVQPFEVEGKTYKTAEHWMMAGKARLFNDTEMLEKIIETDSPKTAKGLGRKVKNFNQQTWEANRYEIVKEGNLHKFSQHNDLKKFLLDTGDQVIVEASPFDPIWGIGLAKDQEGIENPNTWKGLNLLGFALMEVRDELSIN
ncbi:MAG: NADAR family protein [Saprospiraceae bacterium]|jgi:ribA/ribD-fused uncharacterized protein